MTPQNQKVNLEFLPDLRRSLPDDCRLDENQMRQFGIYLELILQWNQRAGLISPADEERLIKRHVVESLGVLSIDMLLPTSEIMDLGTGGGFPGIPLKIALPNLHLTLLDSRRMKALFLEEVVRVLGLQHVQVIQERAENLAGRLSEKFDFVLARAVADLASLWTWSQPLLKKSGCLLAQKGGDLSEEMKRFRKAYPKVQSRQLNYAEWCPIDSSRYIIAIEKG